MLDTKEIDKAIQLVKDRQKYLKEVQHKYACAKSSMGERSGHQNPISVSVGEIRVDATKMVPGWYDHLVIRGREMILLGVVKVFAAEVEIAKKALADAEAALQKLV